MIERELSRPPPPPGPPPQRRRGHRRRRRGTPAAAGTARRRRRRHWRRRRAIRRGWRAVAGGGRARRRAAGLSARPPPKPCASVPPNTLGWLARLRSPASRAGIGAGAGTKRLQLLLDLRLDRLEKLTPQRSSRLFGPREIDRARVDRGSLPPASRVKRSGNAASIAAVGVGKLAIGLRVACRRNWRSASCRLVHGFSVSPSLKRALRRDSGLPPDVVTSPSGRGHSRRRARWA